MKKILISSAALLMSFSSHADWKITDIYDQINSRPAGYILHTDARGIRSFDSKKEKIPTGIRFICSSDLHRQKKDNHPIIGIFWRNLEITPVDEIRISVDGRGAPTTIYKNWNREENLLYRKISDSSDLIDLMKMGKVMTITWQVDKVVNTSTFSLKEFRENLAVFNSKCSLNI